MLNNVFDKVRSTVNTASDTLSTVTQNIVEKNRNKTKLNQLKSSMKAEIELLNNAYIELGKEYYALLKKGEGVSADKSQENLVKKIDNSKAKIARSLEHYRSIKENRIDAPHEDRKDIAVTQYNKEEYSRPIKNTTDIVHKTVKNVSETVKDKAEIISEPIEKKAEVIPEPIEEKAEIIPEPIEEKTEVIPEPIEEKAEVIPEPIEEKTEVIPEPIEEKAEVIPEPIEEKMEVIPEPIVKKAEVIPEPIKKKAEAIPEAVEKKTENSAETTKAKVKKVKKDYQTLKQDNRRLKEALRAITKKVKIVEEILYKTDTVKIKADENGSPNGKVSNKSLDAENSNNGSDSPQRGSEPKH
jgi:hypothetical protein